MRRPLAILTLLVSLPSAALAAETSPDSTAPPAPGQLVDLGGYKLHLWCTGKGGPTVVIVPGAGEHSFNWVLVQPAVAKVTRVCSCDRGGEAWSDLGPKPRTKAQEAFNLRRALHAAGEVGPFVLVGHSMGGDVVRMYAMDHPTEVAGMVLVDAGTPDAMTNLNGHVGTTRSFSHGRAIPAPRESLAADDSLTQLGISRIQEATRSLVPSIGPPFDKLPAEQQRWRLWALGQPKHFIAHDGDYIGEEAERIYAENHRSLSPLADLPLVVLCRDTTVDKSHDPLHVTHQREMARLSRRGEFRIVAGAGHHIHLDRPKAVVDGILQVVKEARESAGAKR